MDSLPADPFFLDAFPGKRFCLYHPPAKVFYRGDAILYLHPFAEEMNKSRRMAALQSRAFAAAGLGVLQIDLYGCGDSEGDFSDAAWEIWKQDIACARQWLIQQGFISIHIWGLRLGALLALDYAKEAAQDFVQFILWQPILNGHSFLTQFLRLRLGNELIATDSSVTSNVKQLREQLWAGNSLEIAGYTLSPTLAITIDNLKINQLAVANQPIHWFEIVAQAGREQPPASQAMIQSWQQAGVITQVTVLPGSPFWSTQEISECPELIIATTRLFPRSES
ncbi:MAG: hydrolase 2, exosortase A system-associated [Nitrosomonas sp.]|nr:hydrolase 2, exosortase A system-associated [Nitrosomonas sp.]